MEIEEVGCKILFSFERSETSQSDRSLKTEQLRRKDITEKV